MLTILECVIYLVCMHTSMPIPCCFIFVYINDYVDTFVQGGTKRAIMKIIKIKKIRSNEYK